MKRFAIAVAVLLCGITARAQLTTVTASSVKIGGVPIASGTVTFTPVNQQRQPIPFVTGGGGLNAPKAFKCQIAAGAITGTCQVPDAAQTVPANILYSVEITDSASQSAFVMIVPGITGTLWPLDQYAPPANTTNVQPLQISYGAAVPTGSCVSPSLYVRNAQGGQLYICVGGSWVVVGGGGGSNPLPVAGATADYNFKQGSGTILVDQSGNGNNGTLGTSTLAPTWTPAGLAFTGQQDVSLPASLNGTQTFVMAVYINPLTNVVPPTNSFPLLISSTVGTVGINLNYTKYLPGVGVETWGYAPSIYNSGFKTGSTVITSGFHIFAYVLGTGGGNLDRLFIDGVETPYTAQGSTAGAQTSGNLVIGSSNVAPWTSSGCNCTFYRLLTYSTQLTPANIANTSAAIRAEVASRGVAVSPAPVPQSAPQLVAVGDSITAGFGVATPWTSSLSLTNQPAYTITNDGINGMSATEIAGSEPNRAAPLCTSSSGPTIAIPFMGTNDFVLYGFSAQVVFDNLAGWIQTMKQAGCKVFVGTMLSRTGNDFNSVSLDTDKNNYDALILSQARAFGADGIIDFAANPLLGADGANANATYFQGDHIHPTQTGQNLLATAASNSLNYYFSVYSLSNPHVITASTTLTSADKAVTASPSAAMALVMPDCTGPSGEVYTISNPQSAQTVTIQGSASQLINGLSTAITIPNNSTVTLRDVPLPKTTSGCGWRM